MNTYVIAHTHPLRLFPYYIFLIICQIKFSEPGRAVRACRGPRPSASVE